MTPFTIFLTIYFIIAIGILIELWINGRQYPQSYRHADATIYLSLLWPAIFIIIAAVKIGIFLRIVKETPDAHEDEEGEFIITPPDNQENRRLW